MSDYASFIHSKSQSSGGDGFATVFAAPWLFDFQSDLVDWALGLGRSAIFADCGLGKTPMQLAWAENVVRHTDGRVLILTPLAVAAQTAREAEKFGVEVTRSRYGRNLAQSGIVVTNYEKLEHFDPNDFVGVVCDESSILKSFDGVRRGEVTRFMRHVRYRLLCTATAAPNDHMELGTSSEALGYMGHMDMLSRFFVSDDGSISSRGGRTRWKNAGVRFRLKGHAEEPFWRWVASWARCLRRPSDLGYDDARFTLPELIERTHVVQCPTPEGKLFEDVAYGMREEREVMKRTLTARCETVAELASANGSTLAWCNLNDEGDLLTRLMPGAVQVTGSDPDDIKEERLLAFANGQTRGLVTKPRIGAFGLNLQNCAHVAVFPTHSFEQYYQGIRRCWRFGQTRPVVVDVVGSEGLKGIMENLARKSTQADEMFDRLAAMANQGMKFNSSSLAVNPVEVPSWL
jgi:hypothetical protein